MDLRFVLLCVLGVLLGACWPAMEPISLVAERMLDESSCRPFDPQSPSPPRGCVRASLGDDSRPALLIEPDSPLDWELTVEPGDRLLLSTGSVATPALINVSIVSGGSERPAAQIATEESWSEHEILIVDRGPIALRFESSGQALIAAPRLLRSAADERPNLLLISIDTLRADHLGIYGYDRPTTPNLDAWAAQHATVFENTIAPAPWTLPSHISLFTGLDAISHGANHGLGLPDLETLAERLGKAGYTTVAITGGSYLHPRYGLGRGFDEHRFRSGEDELADGIADLEAWLEKNRNRRFAAFLHTYEVHSPYRPREPWFSQLGKTEFTGEVFEKPRPALEEEGYRVSKSLFVKDQDSVRPLEDTRLAIDLYDAGLSYTDELLADLLTRIESLGLANDTVIVITSDHGEALGEKGQFGHGTLHDCNLKVPLLIGRSGGPFAGRVVTNQVRLVDLFPTLLELGGTAPSEEQIDGISLLPLATGKTKEHPLEAWSTAASSNRGVSLRLGNRLKLIASDSPWEAIRGDVELYDLLADPAELENLARLEARTESLSDQLEAELEERSTGLGIDFSNSTSQSIRFQLDGVFLDAFRIKSTSLDGPWLELGDGGHLGVELPPGEAFSLRIGSVPPTHLGVRIDGSDFEFDLAELVDPVVVRPEGDQWTSESSDLMPPTGLRLAWRGARHAMGAITEIDDPLLQEQLRSLGYLD